MARRPRYPIPERAIRLTQLELLICNALRITPYDLLSQKDSHFVDFKPCNHPYEVSFIEPGDPRERRRNNLINSLLAEDFAQRAFFVEPVDSVKGWIAGFSAEIEGQHVEQICGLKLDGVAAACCSHYTTAHFAFDLSWHPILIRRIGPKIARTAVPRNILLY